MTKFVYSFGRGKAEGSSLMRNLLGGKGCELAEMTNLGIPVPPGFTITTQAWAHYNRAGRQWPDGLWEQVLENLAKLGARRRARARRRAAAAAGVRPLRRARVDAGHDGDRPQPRPQRRDGRGPGGLDAQRAVRVGLLPALHHDVRRRGARHQARGVRRAARRGSRSGSAWRAIPRCRPPSCASSSTAYKDLVTSRTGQPFPQDPREQLRLAINAVFDSWFAKKAVEYRRINGIPADWGTAVTVMSMVFGNLGETSGTGVGFTRDPRTGERRFYAEFLANAQGEDVVAGIRTPEHIDGLQRRMPEIYDELLAIAGRLERHYKDMQDIEFTIQEGKLYLLQTRVGQALGGGGGAGRRRPRARARDRPAHRAPARATAGPQRGCSIRSSTPASKARRRGRTAAGPRAGGRAGRGRGRRSSSTPTGRWSGPRTGRQVILVRAGDLARGRGRHVRRARAS